jgi:hypothetical protein
VIIGGGWPGKVSLICSSSMRCSGSGCVYLDTVQPPL